MIEWKKIESHISDTLQQSFASYRQTTISGGCINSAYCLEGKQQSFFVKINDQSQLDMFEAEAEGLAEMVKAKAVRIPRPVCFGIAGKHAYLVMEFIQIGHNECAILLGRQLAEMHRQTANQFGWHRQNTIGSTLQMNNQTHSWVDFWRQYRLEYQLDVAQNNGFRGDLQKLGRRLCEHVDDFFDVNPKPALLHGDLWSGNYACDDQGEPVIFDPATYYGDREADIAMTELFGGFSQSFYSAYSEVWPLDKGYSVRKTLYNLYHIINHLNLFGSGYHGQAVSMIKSLLSEIR